MDLIQAAVLGAVQGLTEFFPVSSSGHLVIFQHLFGLREPALFFDISVHMGTLLAVAVYFYSDIAGLTRSFFRYSAGLVGRGSGVSRPMQDPDFRMIMLIAAGCIPTAVLGLGFHKIADRLFASLAVTGTALLFTSALLAGTRLVRAGRAGILDFTVLGALLVGAAQGISVVPGVSRSGATIAACLFLGLDRDTSARYSFLLAMPAIIAAMILGLASGSPAMGAVPAEAVAAGTAVSAVVGYIALSLLVRIVRRGRLFYFAPYCALAAAAALAMGL